MLRHLILGLLRDGEPRHGYQLVSQHRSLTGAAISSGNVYRELSSLASHGLVRARADQAGTDGRRIPYQITNLGRERFDGWLLSTAKRDEELRTWLLFLDRVPLGVRERVLDRARDTLWSQSKALERAREDAIAKHGRAGFNPLPILLSRRLKQVTADLEFLNELRVDLAAYATPDAVSGEELAAGDRPEGAAGVPKRARRAT